MENREMKIYVQAIGTPRITVDGRLYEFPYVRAEAMFFYLLLKGSEEKSVLADIFWGDKYDDVKADRNYRNAVYTIRKALGGDILQNEGKKRVAINRQMIGSDLGLMEHLREMEPDAVRIGTMKELLSRDSLVLLDHLQPDRCSRFDAFLQDRRKEWKELLRYRCVQEMREGNTDGLILGMRLFREDPWDRELIRSLLREFSPRCCSGEPLTTLREMWQEMQMRWSTEPEESSDILMDLERLYLAKEQEFRAGENPEYPTFPEALQPPGTALATVEEWISLFLDQAEDRKLAFFTNLSETQLTLELERLLEANLIREILEEDVLYYAFVDEKHREEVEGRMSETRRRMLHRRMAERFEQQFALYHQEDLLPRIVYHYMRCGRSRKADYWLKELLESYIAISHTYFPAEQRYPIRYRLDTYRNNCRQMTWIFRYLDQYVVRYEDPIQRLDISGERLGLYLSMLVRYYVKLPDFKKAWERLNLWEELQGESEESARQKMALYMDVEDGPALIELSRRRGRMYPETVGDHGFWLRVEGIGHILCGDTEQGRICLNEALACFLRKENQEIWGLNAAVACSWLGESLRLEKCCREAEEYYRWSVELSARIRNAAGQSILYLHVANGKLDEGEDAQAAQYLTAAVDSCRRLDVKYKRASAFLLLALLRYREKRYEDAIGLLLEGCDDAVRMCSPTEIALARRICELLEAHLPEEYAARVQNAMPVSDMAEPASIRTREYLRELDRFF